MTSGGEQTQPVDIEALNLTPDEDPSAHWAHYADQLKRLNALAATGVLPAPTPEPTPRASATTSRGVNEQRD